MKKRVLSLFLVLTLCLGLTAPVMASEDGFTIENGVLTKYDGPGGDVVIPEGVTSIGDYAFASCSGLTGITIPDSVTSIGNDAFSFCSDLTSVTIPGSVTTIGQNAFSGCASLTSITIPESVTDIGIYALSYCSSLTSVTIPTSVTKIGQGMFRDCTSLTDIILPDSVTFIGWSAFAGCSSLTSFTLPESVTYIGLWAFDSCDSLTSITIPVGMTAIGARAFDTNKNLTDIYYAGSEAQWKSIDIEEPNDTLATATIHYNSKALTPTAYASTQTVLVDGKPVEFNAYALKDAAGNMTNYVKLRDVAQVLNGSAAQFQVGWDGSIAITTSAAYTANGSEMVKNFNGDQTYSENTSPVKVDGKAVDMEAITLTDATGGYTYFKLRDLGKALGFNVSWIDGKIVIDPNTPYSDAQ